MRALHKISMILLALTLCACQQVNQKRSEYLRNRSKDYLSSRLIAPLRVPEGLSYPQLSEAYPLPEDLPAPENIQPVPLEPPGFGKLS